MEGLLYLIFDYFGGGEIPLSISRIHTAYIGEYSTSILETP